MDDGQPMCWTVSFDPRRPLETLTATGEGCRIVATADSKTVVIPLPYGRHELLDARASTATIRAGSAVLPVYARVHGDRISLSNRAAELVVPGETVAIRTQVLVQQLLGANYPQYGIFRDIKLLEANAIYEGVPGDLRYVRTSLTGAKDVDSREILPMICAGYEEVVSDGRPLCVLLSGGYDSRLNLAIALHLARRHGNEVHAFHEYKDESEQAVADAVAARAGIPLHTETRRAFSAQVEQQIFDGDFIRFHSATYRDNIPRWHGYLQHILSTVPGGIVFGLGAEPHKGKFYGQVHDLRSDGERAFGASVERIDCAARALGFSGFDRATQRDFFDDLVSHAEQLDDHYSRVDFLHYHTYVVNGYGHRCFDFQQFFAIPFPLLNQDFLAAIFGLPADSKREFRIVKDGIATLAPEMSDIPFVSGNAKALKIRRPGHRSLRERMPSVGVLKDLLVPPTKKGNLSAPVKARLDALHADPRSEITKRLLRALRHGVGGNVRLDYVLQAFLFFRAIEDDHNVTLACV